MLLLVSYEHKPLRQGQFMKGRSPAIRMHRDPQRKR